MNLQKDRNGEFIRFTRLEFAKYINLFDSIINDFYNKNPINITTLSAIDSDQLIQNDDISA